MTLTREQTALIDEFGELTQKTEAFEKQAAFEKYEKNQARREELKAAIAALYDAEPAEKAFTAAGMLWDLPVSERGFKRDITDMAAIHKDLGDTKFLVLCGFRLEDADRHVSDEVKKAAIRKQQIGPRKLGKPIRRFPTAEEKPKKKPAGKAEKKTDKPLAA